MTPPVPARNRSDQVPRGWLAVLVLCVTIACADKPGGRPPQAELIVSAGDSTYWLRTEGSTFRMRGTPMVLARLDEQFLELYVVDDDRSFEDALFIGQRLYQRDIMSGDSTEVFVDTLIPALAERYERANPDARRLAPDEDTGEEPATSATAEISVIGVHGPFLSLEYHVDTAGPSDDAWHMTRHLVVDLRTGAQVTLADVLGPEEAGAVLSRGRLLYRETVDSVRRDPRPGAKRAMQSLGKFRFDPRSFSLTAPNGTLMVAFSAPGEGHGGEGFVLPMRPVPITEPAWWASARDALPTSTREREEHWTRGAYTVKALYDSATSPVQLVIADSAGRIFSVGPVSSPVHRIYFLDDPPISRAQRAALTRAFDEAALYDDAARAGNDDAAIALVQLAVRR